MREEAHGAVLGRLLIVEDDEHSREALLNLAEPQGYQAECAADGEEALSAIEGRGFDLVLLDVTMPGIDGMEVLRRLRQRHSATRLPVIMLTGIDRREQVVAALRAGANDYVVKPFDPAVVLARIHTQLSLKRAVDQALGLERDLEEKNRSLRAANDALELAYRQIRDDLRSAAQVQRALLPAALPPTPGVRFAWTYRPCDDLAGDSLNVFALDEEHVGLYLLDVSGHGVRAALLSVTISRVLAPLPDTPTLVRRRAPLGSKLVPTPPSAVAERLNARFQLDAETYQFFTLCYGVLNVRTGELQYLCAGQRGPIHVPRDGPPVRLSQRGLAIGLVPDPGYRDASLRLGPGDRLYICSDGLEEARDGQRTQFGEQRLVEALSAGRGADLDASLSDLVAAATSWAGRPFDDDVSAIALEVAAGA